MGVPMTLTTHIQTTAPLTATVQHDQAILDTAIQLVLPNMALTTLTSASQLIRGDTHRIRVAISNTDSTPNLQNASVRATFRRQDNNTQLVQKRS
jgi:endonuclease/exonuclease/phosphatase (EEP) superfamily protein YafD